MDFTVQEIGQYPLFIDDYTPLNINLAYQKLARFKREHDLCLVVIDYLGLVESNRRGGTNGNRNNEVSELSRGVKLLAREMRVPIIALSQLSRACELRPGNHKPILGDLRDSGSVEQDSDVVGFLYRE